MRKSFERALVARLREFREFPAEHFKNLRKSLLKRRSAVYTNGLAAMNSLNATGSEPARPALGR